MAPTASRTVRFECVVDKPRVLRRSTQQQQLLKKKKKNNNNRMKCELPAHNRQAQAILIVLNKGGWDWGHVAAVCALTVERQSTLTYLFFVRSPVFSANDEAARRFRGVTFLSVIFNGSLPACYSREDFVR